MLLDVVSKAATLAAKGIAMQNVVATEQANGRGLLGLLVTGQNWEHLIVLK